MREALITTTPSQSGQVPFIRATPVSWSPPPVELVFGGTTPVTMTGTLYTSNWVTARGNWTKAPGTPVEWPAPEAVHASAGATLVLGTSAPPELVLMKVYRDVDPQTGEPTSDPRATYQCNRFSEPRCSPPHHGVLHLVRAARPARTGEITQFLCLSKLAISD